MPCYLRTYITDARHLALIDKYVVAASKLWHRGTVILNLVAQELCV